MLIIRQNISGFCSRPKYHPRTLWAMWSVIWTGPDCKALTAYGPDTFAACQRYQSQHEAKYHDGPSNDQRINR